MKLRKDGIGEEGVEDMDRGQGAVIKLVEPARFGVPISLPPFGICGGSRSSSKGVFLDKGKAIETLFLKIQMPWNCAVHSLYAVCKCAMRRVCSVGESQPGVEKNAATPSKLKKNQNTIRRNMSAERGKMASAVLEGKGLMGLDLAALSWAPEGIEGG